MTDRDSTVEEDDLDEEIATLVGGFAAWLDGGAHDVAGEDDADRADWVDTLLDLRRQYLDEELTTWMVEDLRELFLEVCPRQLGVPAEDIGPAMAAFSRFIDFLEAEELLTPDSAGPADLRAWLRHGEAAATEAMGDTSRWGPSKSLMASLEADGVDLDDDAAVQAWIEAFNARPREERDAVIGRVGPAADLPVQLLPNDDELAQLVRTTALWRQVEGLVIYVGDKLPVTDAGNLKLADARRLVVQLDTGDVIDQVRFGRTETIRPSAELPGLSRTFDLAQAVGLLEHRGRHVWAHADEVAALRDDPVELWQRLVVDWLRYGFLRSLYVRYQTWWCGELDGAVLGLLGQMVRYDQPLELDAVADAVLTANPFGEHDDQDFAGWLRDDVHRWAEQLEVAGLVTFADVRQTTGHTGSARRRGGSITPTPLGVLLLARVGGAPVHRAGELRDAAAGEFLDRLDRLPLEVATTEIDAWLTARDPAAAAAEPASSLADGGRERSLFGFVVLARLGAEARAVVEDLREDPLTRPYASAWLVQHGYETFDRGSDEALDAMLGILVTLSAQGPTRSSTA